jgi:hypothetical protein
LLRSDLSNSSGLLFVEISDFVSYPKGVSRDMVMRNIDDDDCASVPAEHPEDLTDEEDMDLDVDEFDWNNLIC